MKSENKNWIKNELIKRKGFFRGKHDRIKCFMWISPKCFEFIKKYAQEHNITLGQAIGHIVDKFILYEGDSK